jgi:hypothetical protein
MTKVEHTKTHIVDVPNGTASGRHTLHESVLVTDAELVLVECTKEEVERFEGIRLSYITKWVKPLLIAKNEKPFIGDWIYDSYDLLIYRCGDRTDLHGHTHKLLAFPKDFNPSQLQDIVDGKLKEGKCLVECEIHDEWLKENPPFDNNKEKAYFQIKLNPHITIYPVEENPSKIPDDAHSLEVFAIKKGEAFIGFKVSNGSFNFIQVPYTVHNEEKMYTREESINHIVKYIQDNLDPSTHGDIRNVTEWFEQNVK